MWIIPAIYLMPCIYFDMYTCVNTKSIEENLQWKKRVEDLKSIGEKNSQRHSMLHNSDINKLSNHISKEQTPKLIESFDHYPFTVYPLPISEMGKPIDPLNMDFHMSRFSFGNPHYINAGYQYSQILPWAKRMHLFLRNCNIFERSSCWYYFINTDANLYGLKKNVTLMISVQGDPRHHNYFLSAAMPFFEKRFAAYGSGIYLFSGGGADRSFDGEIAKNILKYRSVLRWVVEGNGDCEGTGCEKDPRTVFVPLGLAIMQNSGKNGEALRAKIKQSLQDSNRWTQSRKDRVLVCFGGTTEYRTALLQWAMSKCTICDFCDGVSTSSSSALVNATSSGAKVAPQEQLWQLYTQYKFIFSPRGHGLDCHRTFEILLLGGIPIVEHFTGVLAYKRANLSVITVADKEEINPQSLQTWLSAFRDYRPDETVQHRLSMKYWQTVAFE